MENKLDIRVGDVVLLPVKVQSVNPGVTCYGETPSKQNVAFAWHEIHSVIKRAETPEEELERLRAELAKAPRRIEWNGGECPVPLDHKVVVYLSSGLIDCGYAHLFTWGHHQDHDNMIAYMVLPQ